MRPFQEKRDATQNGDQYSPLRIEVKPTTGLGLPKSQSFCADLLKAKSLLKTSQSFPEDLSDALAPGRASGGAGTATSTGTSSTGPVYVTYLPVNTEQNRFATSRLQLKTVME